MVVCKALGYGLQAHHKCKQGVSVTLGMESWRAKYMSGCIDIEMLRAAADRGESEAQMQLAFQLIKGEALERDWSLAAHYYLLAARQGASVAQHNLATMYLNGQGVERDAAQARYWFELAADQNDVDAMFALALIYEEQDLLDDAHKWYQCAAENGSARAQYDLAVIYHSGRGRDKDIGKALFWYEKAARQGVRRAEQAVQLINEQIQ